MEAVPVEAAPVHRIVYDAGAMEAVPSPSRLPSTMSVPMQAVAVEAQAVHLQQQVPVQAVLHTNHAILCHQYRTSIESM